MRKKYWADSAINHDYFRDKVLLCDVLYNALIKGNCPNIGELVEEQIPIACSHTDTQKHTSGANGMDEHQPLQWVLVSITNVLIPAVGPQILFITTIKSLALGRFIARFVIFFDTTIQSVTLGVLLKIVNGSYKAEDYVEGANSIGEHDTLRGILGSTNNIQTLVLDELFEDVGLFLDVAFDVFQI